MNNNIDLECKYISGKVVYVDGVPIYPLPLDYIFELGYSTYNRMLNYICISSSVISDLLKVDYEEEEVFNFLIANCLTYDNIYSDVIGFFNLICRDELFISKDGVITNADNTIQVDNFNFLKIQKVIKQRNGVENIKEDIDNPSNEMARRLIEKRNKLRKKLEKQKHDESGSSEITIVDLVSILASGLGLEIETVCKYDIYQFNDQFNRLKIFKDYEVNIQALLAGANKEDINLVHWLSGNGSQNNEEDNYEF
jgi:hypothetical protein